VAKRILLFASLAALVVTSMAVASGGGTTLSWQLTPTGSTARLRGVSAVNHKVAWASGSLGTVLRTVDRGATWASVGPPGTAALQFRDIEAFGRNRAVILSIGNGGDSRVYWTEDGGAHWTLGFQNPDPNAFYDCMAFFDRKHGLALSDPVNGKFRIISTSDGGKSWSVVNADMPPALPDEFAFAASGQCLVTVDDQHGHGGKHKGKGQDKKWGKYTHHGHGGKKGDEAWFATGGGAQSRVFRTKDGGETWKVSATPIPSNATSGIFALAFRDAKHGLAVGGDFNDPPVTPNHMALTSDGGKTWTTVTNAPNRYRSGAHWIDDRAALVVGPSGSNVSFDRGLNWQQFDTGSFDTVDCAHRHACWAAGVNGRVAYLVRSKP
jgi:photosystem II stability/assembly factor-like uncharacterized protein